MDHSLFFCNVEHNEFNSNLIELLSQFFEEKSVQTNVINAPLGVDASAQYEFNDAVVVLMPKQKLCFVNLKEDQDMFEEFCEDFIEDLGYLSEKFEYREQLGRPRAWKKILPHICRFLIFPVSRIFWINANLIVQLSNVMQNFCFHCSLEV